MAKKIKTTALDRKWSKAVKERDHWTCQRCSTRYPEKSRGLHAAHIFSRRFKKTRHDPENGVALCFGCHSYFHANPLEFHEWAEEQLGVADYELLKERAQKIAVN